MKKIASLVIVVIIAVFVVGPYISGKVAESETRKLVENMNMSAAEYGSTDIISYERSARSTTAKYSYTLPSTLAGLFDRTEPIEYSCDSQHGITGIDYTCKFDGESDYSKFVSEKLGGNDPLSIHGSVSVFGGLSQTVSLKEIKDMEIDGETVNLPNMNISVTTDSSMEKFDLSGKSDAFTVEKEGEKLSMGEVNLSGDLNHLGNGLVTGDFEMDLANFDMQGAQGNVAVKNMRISTLTKENGDNLDSSVKFTVDEMTDPGEAVNSVEDVAFNIVVNGVDTEAMLEYQAFATQMQRDLLASADKQQAPAVDPMQMTALMPIIERMLKKGLVISTQIDAKLNGEPNTFNLDLKLLESMTFAQLPAFMTQPDEALKKVDVKLVTSLDKKLIDGQAMVGGMISQSPLVESDSDTYKVDLKLGEKIELNGKTMSFQELQGLVFSSMPM